MAVVISSRLIPLIDATGGRIVEGFFLVEFRDATYTPGGENLALGNLYRGQIEYVNAQPASGALNYTPYVNHGDYPTNGGSGRLQLFYAGSSLVTLNVSGLAITILSGHPFLISGFIGPVSGRINAQGSGAINAGVAPLEILSGTAVSGIRAKLHVVGY